MVADPDVGLRRRALGLRPLLLWCTVGLVLGAALGYLVGGSRPGSDQAEASISILPAPTVTTTSVGGTGGDQDATAFIQSELLVLNGRSLKTAVQADLELSDYPDITSSQVGLTYNVSLVATAPSDERAIELLGSTIDTYAARRKQALTTDIDRAVKSVNVQLDTVRTSLATPALRPSTDAGNNQLTQVVALQEEYGRLLAINSALGLARGQVARAVTTVEPPALAAPGLASSVIFAVAGGLFGALAGLGSLLLVRRSSTRVRAADDLFELGLPVLLPALPRDPFTVAGAASGAVSTRARLLSARLVTAAGDARAVVLFGAVESPASGFAATAVAASLAERGPVLLVLASDVINSRTSRRFTLPGSSSGLATLPPGLVRPEDLRAACLRSDIPGLLVLPAGRPGSRRSLERLVGNGLLEAALQTTPTVVVEAPPLSTSSATLELARRAAGGVLVVAQDRVRTDDVVAVRDIFAAQDIPLNGALLTVGGGRTVRRLASRLRAGRRVADRDAAQPGTGSEAAPSDDASPVTEPHARRDPARAQPAPAPKRPLPADLAARSSTMNAPADDTGQSLAAEGQTPLRSDAAASSGSDARLLDRSFTESTDAQR